MSTSEMKPPAPLDSPRSGRWPFNYIHLIVLLICWFPLNPLFVEAIRNPNFGISFSIEALVGILGMICGPFAPFLYYHRPAVDQRVMFVGTIIMVVSLLIQILWRPTTTTLQVVRLLLWGIGCWVWLALSFVAFAMLM